MSIMVARGDLGVEIGDAELPAIQKSLIKNARSKNTVVITATQMMQSMIESPIPTRAEVFDVANAVMDGTDAVMLSAETAAGKYPVKAVEAMDRVCREAEKTSMVRESDHRLHTVFGRVDEAIAMATMYTANHLGCYSYCSTDRIWLNTSMDVENFFRHSYLCDDLTCGDSSQSYALSWCLPGEF